MPPGAGVVRGSALGLLGLRTFEATAADIADLGEEHGYRVLSLRHCRALISVAGSAMPSKGYLVGQVGAAPVA
jgi:hypothetical protein